MAPRFTFREDEHPIEHPFYALGECVQVTLGAQVLLPGRMLCYAPVLTCQNRRRGRTHLTGIMRKMRSTPIGGCIAHWTGAMLDADVREHPPSRRLDE